MQRVTPMPRNASTNDASQDLAAEICARSADANWTLRPQPGDSADKHFERLMENDLLDEAVLFLALRLNVRQAVWWGCLVAWNAEREACMALPASPSNLAIGAAVRWAIDPDDDLRREAHVYAQTVGPMRPSGVLATALFWSGGSVAPADCPAVFPPADVAPRMVANVVRMATALAPLEEQRGRLLQSLRLGVEVLAGLAPWEAPPSSPQAICQGAGA